MKGKVRNFICVIDSCGAYIIIITLAPFCKVVGPPAPSQKVTLLFFGGRRQTTTLMVNINSYNPPRRAPMSVCRAYHAAGTGCILFFFPG